MRRWLAAAAVALLSGTVVAAAPQRVLETEFALAEADTPPAEAAWTRQALPDEWRVTRPEAAGTGWYRFKVSLPAAPVEPYALYASRGGDQLAVFVNGTFVASTGASGDPVRTWKRPQLFSVAPALLAAGENLVHVRVYGRAENQSGLSALQFGPEAELRDLYWTRYGLQAVGPVSLSVALGLIGIFFLILWTRRRQDSMYALFGVASLLWAARNVIDVLYHLAIPQPHWEIWLTVLYQAFVGLLCVFGLRYADLRLPRYEWLLRWSIFSSPLVLYAALSWVSVLAATRGVLLLMLSLVVPPTLAVTIAAVRQRNRGVFLMALAGAVAVGFGAYDWLATLRQDMFDSVRLVPYAALFFCTAVGWLLVHRFMATYSELEQLNAELDERVATKSAELRRNLEQLEKAKAEADEANLAKSRFLAAASHDLRQPLHALGLFAASLGMKARSPQTQDLVLKMNQSIEALEEMFTELLDVSRLDAGTVAVERRRFDLQEMFDRLAVDFLPLAQEKGLSLRIRPTREWTDSDPMMFERILRNLVSNAIRYTHRGGVLLGCRRRGKRLWVQVWDTGIGIPESERDRIFEEFYQVGNAERDRRKGLGLGLGIVRRLVALLGERLTLHSVVGRGSVFALRSYRALPPLQAAAREALPAASFAESHRLVALVEDDALVRDAMEGLLARRGLSVAAGACLGEVRAALARSGRTPDLVIADYRLRGGESGVAVGRSLQEEYGAAIPVLLLTGETCHEQLAEAAANAFPILRKPVTGSRLFAQIEALLARGAGPASAAPAEQPARA